MVFTSLWILFFLSRITEMFSGGKGESRPSYLSTSTTELGYEVLAVSILGSEVWQSAT